MAKSLKQLKDEYEKARVDTIARLRSKWEAEAIEEGLSFAEIIGKSRPEAKEKRTIEAKYRNPDDPSDTWSGQGYPPRKWSFCWVDTGKKNSQGKPIYEPAKDYKARLIKKGYTLAETPTKSEGVQRGSASVKG